LKKLDQFIGGKKFATGDNITLVDFMLYELEDSVRCFSEETFNSLTNLTAHFANFSEIPQIKAYRSSGRF
jgi:glutathione S-transferase